MPETVAGPTDIVLPCVEEITSATEGTLMLFPDVLANLQNGCLAAVVLDSRDDQIIKVSAIQFILQERQPEGSI